MIFNKKKKKISNKKTYEGILKKKGVGDFQSPREQYGPIIAALVPLALPPSRHKYEQDMYIFLRT